MNHVDLNFFLLTQVTTLFEEGKNGREAGFLAPTHSPPYQKKLTEITTFF